MFIKTNQSWWVEIEGVAERITFGEPAQEAFRLDYDEISQIPEPISDDCDPITAELNLSSFSFVINANDEMVRLFLYQQMRPPSFLFSSVADTDSFINIDPGLSLSAGDRLYIGSETMRVISTVGVDPQTVNVGRGNYGTRAQEHRTGDPVFSHVPRWRGRRIQVYTRDVPAGEFRRLRWTGYIDTISRGDDGTRINITARNLWSAAIATTSARSSLESSSYRLTAYDVADNSLRPLLRGGGLIDKPVPVLTEDNPEPVFYTQVDDSLVAMRVIQEYDFEFSTEADSRPLLGTELDEEYETGERFNVDIRPLFVVSPLADEEWIRGREDAGLPIETVNGNPVTPSTLSPWMTQFHDHPFLIALFLLTGGIINEAGAVEYTNFADNFTLDFSELFGIGFGTSLRNLIRETPDLKVDHFILGWNGEKFDVIREVSERLLRPFGAFFGLTQSGAPRVRLFGAITVADILDTVEQSKIVEALPGPWVGGYDLSLENSVDVVSAEVGGLPWCEPRNITVQAFGAGSGRSRIGDAGRWDLDYSTISKSRSFDVLEDLIRKSTLSSFSFPRARFRCPDTGKDGVYDIGATVQINTLPVQGPYLLDRNGELVDDLQDDQTKAQFIGIIIGRSFNISSRVYDIKIMLTGFLTEPLRFRGPAGVIAEYDAGEDYFLLEESPFSSPDDNDVDSFDKFFNDETMTVQLEIHHADLRPTGNIFTVDEFLPAVGVGGAIRTVETPTENYDGLILRLTALDSGYVVLGSLPVYNFLADDGGDLPFQAGHEYG